MYRLIDQRVLRVLATTACVLLAFAVIAVAQKPPLDARVGGILVGDQSMDGIYLTRDLNGDGDADDLNESTIYYYDPNGTTGSVTSIFQSYSGYVLYADTTTDAIYKLTDVDEDCDAMDPGEFSTWFSNANVMGWVLTSPSGIWQDDLGAVYVLNAGTTNTPVDAIYRTVDLNGDGDADDATESYLWMDVQNLMANSAAFEMVFIGDTAYWVDSMGGDSDAIVRAHDDDGDGTIGPGEFNVFIDESGGFGVGVFSALATDGVSLYVIDLSGTPQVLYRLTDLNGSGDIDDDAEVEAVWDETHVPAGFEMSSTYAIAIGPNREFAITSNGSDTGTRDNVFRVVDLDGDGLYTSDGETIVWVQGNGDGTFVERARSVEYILPYTGDVDGDGAVDLTDLALLLAGYGYCSGDDGFNAAADLDHDGCVTLTDLATLLARYGHSCP